MVKTIGVPAFGGHFCNRRRTARDQVPKRFRIPYAAWKSTTDPYEGQGFLVMLLGLLSIDIKGTGFVQRVKIHAASCIQKRICNLVSFPGL